jgi:para-nitrobenzyl esterase
MPWACPTTPTFAHPNAGMLDIIAALEWVRDNISAFGGDPGNVTLFGQSGGGLKISVLMAMPAAKGLFHKAIVQSGSQPHVFKAADTERVAMEFIKAMGLSGRDLSALKTAPIDQLMAAEATARAKIMRFPLAGQKLWTTVGWAPSIDGRSIPRDPFDGPPAVDASLLIGSTRHEFNPAVFMPAQAEMTEADLGRNLARTYGDRAAQIHGLFRARHPDEPPAALSAIISSAGFNRANAVEQASLAASRGGRAYLYLFDWRTPVLDNRPGAYHCSELPLVFHKRPTLRHLDGRRRTRRAYGRPHGRHLDRLRSIGRSKSSGPARLASGDDAVGADHDPQRHLAVGRR